MAKKNDAPVWSPQPGPQALAIGTKLWCDELLFGGSRGGGKSEFMLMDFFMDVKEWKNKWHGVLFRRSYPQLDDIVQRAQEIYRACTGQDGWRSGDYTYKFPGGSTLKFRHLDNDADASNYLGHSYGWVGFEELTQWSTDGPYKKLLATVRSTTKGLPKRIRSTSNPGSVGHGWVKRRFIDMAPEGSVPFREEKSGMTRMFIRSRVQDNKILLQNDPGYVGRIRAAAAGNKQLLRAWLYGDWDVFFGQFFSSFDPKIHKVDPLKVLPNGKVPSHWRIEGSLDYGESKPTAFCLWATNEHWESYLIAEYYKSGLWLSEHVSGIWTLCQYCPYTNGRMPERIWADPQIFYTRASANSATMNRMVADVFKNDSKGQLKLVKSNRDRVAGWRFLKNQMAVKFGPDGEMVRRPKIFYFPECEEFERTTLGAVYAGSEESPSEDMDTDGEDHLQDSARYFVMGSHRANAVKDTRKESGLSASYVFGRNRKARKGMTMRREAPMITPMQLWPRSETETMVA